MQEKYAHSDIYKDLQSVPEFPYGMFSEKDNKILKKAKDYLCQGDKEKELILNKYIEAYIKNFDLGIAYEQAGESQ